MLVSIAPHRRDALACFENCAGVSKCSKASRNHWGFAIEGHEPLLARSSALRCAWIMFFCDGSAVFIGLFGLVTDLLSVWYFFRVSISVLVAWTSRAFKERLDYVSKLPWSLYWSSRADWSGLKATLAFEPSSNVFCGLYLVSFYVVLFQFIGNPGLIRWWCWPKFSAWKLEQISFGIGDGFRAKMGMPFVLN